MKPWKETERLVKRGYLSRLAVPWRVDADRRILDAACAALHKSQETNTADRPYIWRTIMQNRTIRIASAGLIIVVAVLSFVVLERSAEPAYALEQTIDAIAKIETVHMAGDFYRQGKFECWMVFAGDPDQPTHMWLGLPGSPICKICTPEHVFGLNRRTKAVHLARRDERHQDWVLRFGQFFEEAVQAADGGPSVEIRTERDGQTGKEVILVSIETPKRAQEFLVDPTTKLPMRFSTTRDDAPMEMLRKPLVVRNLEWIRYNEEPPEGLFDMPTDARIVDQEIDAMVHPDAGIMADGLTEQEACVKLMTTLCEAIEKDDRATFERLFLLPVRDEHWQALLGMRPVRMEHDEPYKEGHYWYLPCRIIAGDGRIQQSTPMIKFYDMEGKSYCFRVGSKEHGLVD